MPLGWNIAKVLASVYTFAEEYFVGLAQLLLHLSITKKKITRTLKRGELKRGGNVKKLAIREGEGKKKIKETENKKLP